MMCEMLKYKCKQNDLFGHGGGGWGGGHFSKTFSMFYILNMCSKTEF